MLFHIVKRQNLKKMNKVIQISILAKIFGNVNADENIGNRITLKKMYSSTGEVLPFVSARAIKYAIRQALKTKRDSRGKNYEIDPLIEDPQAKTSLRLRDSGRPDKYIDNDLFGFMVTIGENNVAYRRQAPIALSYFKALKDTPIRAEFAARFPRMGEKEFNPVPFEVEVAEFIGKLNCLIYDYIGDFTEEKKQPQAPKDLPDKLDIEERKNRLKVFLEVFLTPSYVLPRRTNSLNIPEYIASLIVLSEKGPLPIYQYLDFDFNQNCVDTKKLEELINRKDLYNEKEVKMFFIDYTNSQINIPNKIEKADVNKVINKCVEFLF